MEARHRADSGYWVARVQRPAELGQAAVPVLLARYQGVLPVVALASHRLARRRLGKPAVAELPVRSQQSQATGHRKNKLLLCVP